jgi:hypothetical protein
VEQQALIRGKGEHSGHRCKEQQDRSVAWKQGRALLCFSHSGSSHQTLAGKAGIGLPFLP